MIKLLKVIVKWGYGVGWGIKNRKIKNQIDNFWGKYFKVQIKYLQNESLYAGLFLPSLPEKK